MELIKIADDKLKIMLTEEDMRLYEIEFDLLDYGNTETRRAIWNILDQAKKQLGFEAAKDKILIQAFRGMSGGCELFVSRSTQGEQGAKIHKRLYRFASAVDAINACLRLENSHYLGISMIYLGDDDRFYLVLEGDGKKSDIDSLSFLEEMSCPLPFREEYLLEHTKLLCHGAVSTLAKLK